VAAQILLLLVVAAGRVAYILLGRPQDLGGGADAARPERGRPLGPAAILRGLLKFVLKEPMIPAGANKGVFLLAPLVTCVLALRPGR
jgi:NADH-quinone oxidoreductase subunit H